MCRIGRRGLMSAYSQPASGEPLPLPEEVRHDEMAGVLDLVEPLMRQGAGPGRAGIDLAERDLRRSADRSGDHRGGPLRQSAGRLDGHG